MNLVIVSFDIFCKWSGKAPTYRIYVDDELQTERDYKYNNNEVYLNERLPLYLTSGMHSIQFENLGNQSIFSIENFTIDKGNATVIKDMTFEVTDEN